MLHDVYDLELLQVVRLEVGENQKDGRKAELAQSQY